ncbi:hypothetical protein CHS0354_012140 [Potamilus streckersoni]|uniref:Kinase n=1 Tax=Potamilus streckersoni TaxID=2493646 RepID=A0AAE0SA59_9BIVA|nr:hypothetical protein CHS0354_012140 [Potamilus streckersoni]
MSLDDGSERVMIPLAPFVHQVGGHTCVLKLNKSAICKPMVDRELKFYRALPDEMKEFAPKFLGEVDVLYRCGDDGVTTLIASVPKSLVGMFERKDTRKKNSSSSEGDYRLKSHSWSDFENGAGSWSQKCIERQISQYRYWANNAAEKFIVLENLVHGYRHPCMLDIKLGTRQQRDDANCSPEKRKLLEDRCSNTTSATLGFRICGMQVYQRNTQTYLYLDKYYGRTLNQHTVIDEFRRFFRDGNNIQVCAIACIADKLEKMIGLLEQEDKFTLNSCSLLLMHDLEQTPSKDETCNHSLMSQVHVTEDEFQQSSTREPGEAIETSQIIDEKKNSEDVFFSDIRVFSCKPYLGSAQNSMCSLTGCVHDDDYNVKERVKRDYDRSSAGQVGKLSPLLRDDTVKGDVRLIDFAHVKLSNEMDGNEVIVDEGIVFGLKNILSILKSLLKE